MVRWWLRATAVTVAVLACSIPNTVRALEHVPFAFDDGTIRVQGTVNGQNVPMRIDLGAGVNVLSRAVGSRSVDVSGKFTTLSLTGQRVDLPIGRVVSMALGEFKVDSTVVGIWDGLDGTGTDGLISASAFRDVTATFNMRDHELLMEDPVTVVERTRLAARIPLVLRDEMDISLGIFARFDFGNGQTGLCAIDTGTPDIMIDRRFAKKMGINLADPSLKRVKTPLGEGIGATIPALTLIGDADAALKNPNVVFEDLVDDCNVGNAFWANKIFTLDIPHKFMFVAPPA